MIKSLDTAELTAPADDHIGDSGMSVLTLALRWLSELRNLNVTCNQIGQGASGGAREFVWVAWPHGWKAPCTVHPGRVTGAWVGV
jgi:hypothetical protein